MDQIFIMLIASLAAVSCCIIGTFLVLRNMAMMSDAIAHAVLPGIAASFLLTGSKSSLVMLIGASSVGVFATFLIEYSYKKIKIQSDAAIGINFTWLFALGIIIISIFSKKVDLDPDCVIYGEIAYSPLDLWITKSGINMGPRAIYILSIILLMNIIFVVSCYKELKITTFDPAFASSLGIRTGLWHYLLMSAASITTVATFEVAGVVLNVAFIVVPAATAYLITNDLKKMFVFACLFGVLASILGYVLAVVVNSSISGCIATLSGLVFCLVFLLKDFIIQRVKKDF